MAFMTNAWLGSSEMVGVVLEHHSLSEVGREDVTESMGEQ